MSDNKTLQDFDPEPPDEYYEQFFNYNYDRIIPAVHLPEGWEWRIYDDGNGGLYSPKNEQVVEVDFATSEYKREKEWSFIDGYPYETISSGEFMENMEKRLNRFIERENKTEKGGNLDMNENGTTANGGGEKGNLMENEHVKELFGILQDNGKDTSGLTAIINHVNGMEDFVKRAEEKIADMKSQLETMKEVQDHPLKTTLQNTIKALEAKVAEIKQQISELKDNIIEGCKNAVTAFKEKGAVVLDKLASFFKIKSGLQSIKNNTVKNVNYCDKAVAQIETFSKQYHTAGRALKNMGRVLVGKQPIDAVKESGKMAKAFSAPYKAEKACLLGIRKQVDKMIASLDKLEQGAEAKRNEQVANKKEKKPTLMERLDAKKKEIKERELEAPKKERTLNKTGLEV